MFADTYAMEEMLPPEGNAALDDMAVDLLHKTSALTHAMNPAVRGEVGLLVRSMNCYYSNLIEGHNTTPRDIDRALAGDYSTEPKKRALQEEAKAHIEVQGMIDRGVDGQGAVDRGATGQGTADRGTNDQGTTGQGMTDQGTTDQGAGPQVHPASRDYVLWLHRAFCSRLPSDLLWVENPDTGARVQVIPGEVRSGDVSVGRHVPPSHDLLDKFLARFEQAYHPRGMSKCRRVVAAAAAHHRFLWIHPFYDGNGRVARLMSHAMLLRVGAGSPLWSVARGLARNVKRYKSLLAAADSQRWGDTDGRGNLSARTLTEFCMFFLDVCIDQVDYMASLLTPAELERRMALYVQDEVAAKRLPKGADRLLREALLVGAFARGRAAHITGYKERRARDVVTALLGRGLLKSDSPRGPVRLGFPIDVLERWFPLLYPEVG